MYTRGRLIMGLANYFVFVCFFICLFLHVTFVTACIKCTASREAMLSEQRSAAACFVCDFMWVFVVWLRLILHLLPKEYLFVRDQTNVISMWWIRWCGDLLCRYSFSVPPKLDLHVRPKLGEREVTFCHVTEWIEKKLQDEFQVEKTTTTTTTTI